MRNILIAVSLLCVLPACMTRAADVTASAATPAPVVFFDIAGPDASRLTAFYSGAFGWSFDPTGITKSAGLYGAVRQDPPAKIIYLGVPDVTAALQQVVAAGGKIVRPRFAVPGVVVLGLFTDPAGNSMGLVEIKDGKPVIP